MTVSNFYYCICSQHDFIITTRIFQGAGFQGRKEIAELLFKHGVGLRDKHADGYEPAIRSCWGPELRHTETVEFFLDNGVPLDDIYDECMERGSERTKQLLESRKASNGSEEL